MSGALKDARQAVDRRRRSPGNEEAQSRPCLDRAVMFPAVVVDILKSRKSRQPQRAVYSRGGRLFQAARLGWLWLALRFARP